MSVDKLKTTLMCVLTVISNLLKVKGTLLKFCILGVFTDGHPYEAACCIGNWKPHATASSNIFPILYLSHVTHSNIPADEIKRGKFLTFKAKAKVSYLMALLWVKLSKQSSTKTNLMIRP